MSGLFSIGTIMLLLFTVFTVFVDLSIVERLFVVMINVIWLGVLVLVKAVQETK